MTSTTTARGSARSTAVAGALLPYALTGIADHLLSYRLPVPFKIYVDDGTITLVLLSPDVPAWRARCEIGEITRTVRDTYTLQQAHARLNGSGVNVTLRWLDLHPICRSTDECREPVQPLDGPEPGCPHAAQVCAQHRHECSECVDDRCQDRAEGWS